MRESTGPRITILVACALAVAACDGVATKSEDASALGGSIVIASLWPLLHLPLVLALLYVLVIAREERHLTEAFGDSYRDYQRRVGRWLTL